METRVKSSKKNKIAAVMLVMLVICTSILVTGCGKKHCAYGHDFEGESYEIQGETYCKIHAWTY